MGVEVVVEGLTKSFGKQTIWRDVTLTLPAGEVSALLGPSGTGKSVFLKSMIGLLRPERGKCMIDGTDIVKCSESKLYEIRKLFGVLFQDGALFGSMNLFDNIAFPLREHTKKTEAEVKRIVLEKMEMVGLSGTEKKLPGEISGGMRKRAGLARALVLDPEIILCDEPDSGLDPVRTAYLAQLLIDLNAQIEATILVVTHNINLARTLPDNLGMLFRRELVMFGPREVLLTSEEPVVEQFLNGRRIGPIGMSEEKDTATMQKEQEMADGGHSDGSPEEDVRGIVPQIQPSPGVGERKAERLRKDRVMGILNTLPQAAQDGIIDSLSDEDRRHYGVRGSGGGQPQQTQPQQTQPQNSQPQSTQPQSSQPQQTQPQYTQSNQQAEPAYSYAAAPASRDGEQSQGGPHRRMSGDLPDDLPDDEVAELPQSSWSATGRGTEERPPDQRPPDEHATDEQSSEQPSPIANRPFNIGQPAEPRGNGANSGGLRGTLNKLFKGKR